MSWILFHAIGPGKTEGNADEDWGKQIGGDNRKKKRANNPQGFPAVIIYVAYLAIM